MNVATNSVRLDRVLLEVASIIPAEVAAFMLTQVDFITVGRCASGLAIPPGSIGRKRWVVVLDDRMATADVHGVVGHEIAHCWLSHAAPPGGPDHERHEREASTLARSWGFCGIGTDAEQNEGHAAQDRAVTDARPVGPRVRLHVENGEAQLVCGYCRKPADVFAPAFSLPGAEMVARCRECDWLMALRPNLDCPDCGKLMQASWVGDWRLLALRKGRVGALARVLMADIARRLRGAPKPADPGLIRARCRPCRIDNILRVRLAPRASMLAPGEEVVA